MAFVTFHENHASNPIARSTSIHFIVVYGFEISIRYVVGYWCVLAGEILDWCCQITVGLADYLNSIVAIGRCLADILLERRLVDRAFLRRQSLVDSGGRLRAWPPGHYSHLHGPTNHRRHRQPQGEPFPQRRRLPPGLAHCRFADRVLSVLGMPWMVADTVLSLTHVGSLKMESDVAAPGEHPTFLGVREQRVTNTMISVVIGASIFMTAVLKLIPMPVLFGVFLFMGLNALNGLQVRITWVCY